MKRRALAIGFAAVTAVGASLPLFGGWLGWDHETTIKGIAFEKSKVESSGLIVGMLKADTVIAGRPCRKGWVHLHADGVPVGFTTTQEIALSRYRIPAGTWVIQDTAGVVKVCAFPKDMEVQGHHCRGTGGPKGVQVAFHPGGALKQYFPVRPARIDDVPCDMGLVRGWIELHEDGRLKSCRLAQDFARDGETFRKGARINFDASGRVLSKGSTATR